MKRVKKIAIILIVFLLAIVNFSFAATGKVNTSAVRLREEANTTSNILTTIYKGYDLEVLEQNGEWCKVKYQDVVGYTKKEFIDIKEEKSATKSETQNEVENKTNDEQNNKENTSTYENNTNAVTTNELFTVGVTKMRKQPTFLSDIDMQIDAGKNVTKILEMNNWVKIAYENSTGWVLKNKLSSVNKTQVVANSSDFEDKIEKKEEQKEENNTKKDNEEKVEKTETVTSTPVDKKGIVNVETAKVRSEANLKSKVIGFLDYNDEITITAEEGDWYKMTNEEITGYVNKSLVTIRNDEKGVSSRGTSEERDITIPEPVPEVKDETVEKDDTTVSAEVNNQLSESLASPNNGGNQSVVDYAMQFLGYNYVVGGKNPSTGFDCSGFTRYVFANFGYSLGSTAASQNNIGTEVARENLQPGDLILFYDDAKTKIGHTGIYISNGDFIHSANPSRGVVTDNINTSKYYNTRFITARRIVQ